MKVGIIIGRIGGVDGVALETEKWIEVLKRMGNEVYILSGQFQERRIDPEYEALIPEMSFFSPESFWSQKKAFFHPETNPEELIEHIKLYSKIIYKKIIKWIKKNKINVLISENASALPSHLEMGLAIKKAVKKTGIPTISHDHDFAWERGERYLSPHDTINQFVESVFPLRLPNVIHAVINSHAQKSLLEKYGRTSVLVPNVMDFDKPFGVPNERNQNIKQALGFNKKSILLFQITRIVTRKRIDVAVRMLDRLHDKKLKLIITGNYADDEGSKYYNELVNLIHELHLGKQVSFAYHMFHNKGLASRNGDRGYSLSDAYAQAHVCTYFSDYEGFGNAFVEAILSKTPIFVNNYKPVYWPDIGSKGFKTVMLEDNVITDAAVKEMQKIIYDAEYNKEVAEYNFELGKKHFSYNVLEEKLDELFSLLNN